MRTGGTACTLSLHYARRHSPWPLPSEGSCCRVAYLAADVPPIADWVEGCPEEFRLLVFGQTLQSAGRLAWDVKIIPTLAKKTRHRGLLPLRATRQAGGNLPNGRRGASLEDPSVLKKAAACTVATSRSVLGRATRHRSEVEPPGHRNLKRLGRGSFPFGLSLSKALWLLSMNFSIAG